MSTPEKKADGALRQIKRTEVTQTELQRENKRMSKTKKSMQELWENTKWSNIHIIGILKAEGKEKRQKKQLKK